MRKLFGDEDALVILSFELAEPKKGTPSDGYE